eukprot:296793-Hanusia_phi.AAC.1
MGGRGDSVGDDIEVDTFALQQHVHQVNASNDKLIPTKIVAALQQHSMTPWLLLLIYLPFLSLLLSS